MKEAGKNTTLEDATGAGAEVLKIRKGGGSVGGGNGGWESSRRCPEKYNTRERCLGGSVENQKSNRKRDFTTSHTTSHTTSI